MVISCLTIYAIAFSCFTLLIGKTFADTPVYVDADPRQNDKRGNKIHIHGPAKSSSSVASKTNEKLFAHTGEVRVLQSFYQPSNTVKVKKLENHSIKELNQTHSYFALFDPKTNQTKKFSSSDRYYSSMTLSGRDGNDNYESESEAKVKHNKNQYENIGFKKGKIKNFIVWDTLEDSEKEIRVHYNGITAKETAVKTGVDENTGKSEGLKLRQLTDGINFIQLIYNFDNQIQDCEYLKLKTVIRKFLNTFRKDVERAKISYENQEVEAEEEKTDENENGIETLLKEDDEDYLEGDEGKIEQYLLDEEEYEGENLDGEYRNVTFQIISDGEKLPKELAAWMNYPKLRKQCRENQKLFKSLAFNREHGDEQTKKMAEEHIERRKRDIADVLLVPGTKWCGKGRRATKYTSLGGFSRTDKCCRVHDTMCPHWIGGLQKKYGLFNWRINTIMHCRCDKRFRACLKMAKTGTANFVGKLFFNVVQTKCFVLKPKEVCLKYSRWGKCEKTEFRKQAHLKDNLQY